MSRILRAHRSGLSERAPLFFSFILFTHAPEPWRDKAASRKNKKKSLLQTDPVYKKKALKLFASW